MQNNKRAVAFGCWSCVQISSVWFYVFKEILLLLGLFVPVLLKINKKRTGSHKCSAITLTHLGSKLLQKFKTMINVVLCSFLTLCDLQLLHLFCLIKWAILYTFISFFPHVLLQCQSQFLALKTLMIYFHYHFPPSL